MEEFLHNFHFIRPWWLVLLLLLPVLWFRFFTHTESKSAWRKVCDKRLLEFLLSKSSPAQQRLVSLLALAGFAGAILALAGPSWKKTEIPNLSMQNPVMMVLNLSSEMAKEDVTPDRLARAKYKIADLLKLLNGEQTGLIVYTSEPFLITPITDDSRLIDNLLPEISTDIMPLNGERLDRAISLAAAKLKDADFANGNIIIFSGDAGSDFSAALDAAQNAKSAGFVVSVLCVGAQNSEQLEMLSGKGGGRYYKISAGETDVRQLAAFIAQGKGTDLKESGNQQTIWLDYGYFLTIIPLLGCLYFFRKGVLVLAFLLLAMPGAQAGFFRTNNQEGQLAFNQGDYQAAAEKFERPDWKASSLYKAGHYDDAYAFFAQGNGEEALYNQGNALAKAGKINEAIEKYEEVLKQNPAHDDAKFNLEYLKQQQQNQQQSGGNGDNNEQNQDENQQSPQQQNSENGENDKQSSNNQQSAQEQQNTDNSQQQDNNKGVDEDKGNEKENTAAQQTDEHDGKDSRQQEQSASGRQEKESAQDEQQQPFKPMQRGEDNDDGYDEHAQALEQQYRQIPEDPGGLLRAYIYKEYMKNRYED